MSQDTHDRKVRQLASKLQKDGWKVQADLKGLDRPTGIGKNNQIPDIVAKKRGATKIVEVDTPETIDNSQLTSFERSAKRRSRTTFQHVVTKPRKGKRSR